jgi:isoleucyl-tRNA synthetase
MDIEIGVQFNPVENDKTILQLWSKDGGIYKKWSDKDSSKKDFNFVDGPPFVSSNNLHYGHILVSLMKSSVLYYERMNGKNVENKLGYDTHGLPIEMAVNKLLDVHTRKDVLELGVDKYNQKCKETIASFSGAWQPIFEMVGRITSDDHYKTMDYTFMESVWWVFKQLYNKGLVYQGVRVMPYSPACNTPLSNFEASQNYKDVEDITVYVSFKIASIIPYIDYSHFPNSVDCDVYIVAWTTTPWTLPANMALCINENENYVIIHSKKKDKYLIIAQNSITKLFQDYSCQNSDYNIIDVFIGKHLVDVEYEPLFHHVATENHRYRIVADNYVQCFPYEKDKSPGSGVVHLAPGFGEDDYRVCKNWSVIKSDSDIYVPIDDNGVFQLDLLDGDLFGQSINGKFYKETNRIIIKYLDENEQVIKKESYRHNYPFCWRTDTPLIYRAMDSWFIETTKLRDDMLENNKKINWYPSHIGSGRFQNWLENTKEPLFLFGLIQKTPTTE